MSSPQKGIKEEEMVFSPVKSPVAELPQGNLTGKPRKLKDGAADVHNLIFKWKQLNQQGAAVVNQIANIKLEKVFNNTDEEEILCSFPLSLEPLCEKLLGIYRKMNKVVLKLETIRNMISGIMELSNYQCKDSNSEIYFKTWNLQDFLEAVTKVYDMLMEELKLKKCLVEHVAHANNRQMMMLYSAAWIHQPYITNLNLLIDSLLLETGLK